MKKIGDNAFEGCISLDFMESLAGVDSIGTRAFYRCSSLGAVMLAPACAIGPEAFATCKNLNDVRCFEGTTWERLSPFRNTPWLSGRAGDGTFIEGGKLLAYVGEQREYTIPQGVVEIAASAFENNALIEKVTIRDGTKIIGDRAFAFCENLKSVTIPDSVTQIDDTAFFGSPEVVFRCYRGSVASTFRLHNKIKVDYISRVLRSQNSTTASIFLLQMILAFDIVRNIKIRKLRIVPKHFSALIPLNDLIEIISRKTVY